MPKFEDQIKANKDAVTDFNQRKDEWDKTPTVLVAVSDVFSGIASVLLTASPLIAATEKGWGLAVKLLGGFFEGLANRRKKKK
jgi:hypothetical protein